MKLRTSDSPVPWDCDAPGTSVNQLVRYSLGVAKEASMSTADQALAELRTGRMDKATFRLVASSATKLARSGRFSAPGGGRRWSSHDVEDLVGDFFEKSSRSSTLVLSATTPEHLCSEVERILGNLINDRFRATPRGVLWRRVRRRVSGREDVRDVPPEHWALEPHAAMGHWAGDKGPLERAASGVEVQPVAEWKGERSTPACSTQSVDDLCDVVLHAASSPVRRGTLLAVVTERVLPDDVERVVDDPIAGSLAEGRLGPLDTLIAATDHESARNVAETIFWSLDDNEKKLVGCLDASARQIADSELLGVGKSAVAERIRKLKLSLAEVLHAVPDQNLVVSHLLNLLEEWNGSAGQRRGVDP